MTWLLGPAAAALSMVAPFIYMRSILRGESKPHRTSRLVLLVCTALMVVSLVADGVTGAALWLAGAQCLQCAVTFAMSLKYGVGGWSRLDIGCLGLATAGIVAWQTTSDPMLALAAAILADFFGFVPTLVKTWFRPETESRAFYLVDTVAGAMAIGGLATVTASSLAFPLYILGVNAAMVWLAGRRRSSPLASWRSRRWSFRPSTSSRVTHVSHTR